MNSLKPLLFNQEFLDEFQGDRDRAERTLNYLALAIKIFNHFGPGRAEAAWKAQVKGYGEGKGGAA